MAACRRIAWILLLVLATLSGNAMAWSCRDLEHRYVLQCSAGKCPDAFLVAQVPSFGRCGRTLDAIELDDDARRFVVELAQASTRVLADGIHVMRVPGSGRMLRRADGSLDSFFEQFESTGRLYRRNPDVALRTMPPAALSEELHGAMGRDWLSLDERFATLDAARIAFRAQAWWQHSVSDLLALLYFACIVGPPILLLWSADDFFAQLRVAQRPTWHVLAAPVAVQLAVLSLAPLGLVFYGVEFLLLLVPVVVGILTAEAVSWLRHGVERVQATDAD